jgi:hypothetical protein
VSLERRRDVVVEAITLNDRMREQVREKLDVLQSFLAELEAKAARYRQIAAELDVDVPGEPRPEVTADAGA